MKKYQGSTLSNGLNLITTTDENSEIVTIGLFVKAGARYEGKDQFGYAHLLEHMLLKGSRQFPSVFSVAKVTDRAGAYLNASTGAEKIILTVQVTRVKLPETIRLLADIIKNPLFDPAILENEKKVIKQEIGKIYDSHLERIWLETVTEIFPGHPLGHHPIGDETTISLATTEALKDYWRAWFVPQRAVLVFAGGMTHDQTARLANEYFVDWLPSATKAETLKKTPPSRPGFKFVPVVSRQTYLNLLFTIPRLTLKDQLVLDIISEYLGHGRTSLLNQELRQKKGLVYSLSSGTINYQDTSLLRIFTATNEPEQIMKLIPALLDNSRANLTGSLLNEYKEQIKNHLQRDLSDPFKELDFLGGNWVLYEEMVTPAEVLSLIDNITSVEVAKIWEEYLTMDNLTTVALGEKNFST